MEWYLKVLRNYAGFDGRARRKEFWMFFLINLIINYALMFIGFKINMPFLSTIYAFAILIPYIAVWIRRMHDVGKSGWYLLIPIYNIVLAATATYPNIKNTLIVFTCNPHSIRNPVLISGIRPFGVTWFCKCNLVASPNAFALCWGIMRRTQRNK